MIKSTLTHFSERPLSSQSLEECVWRSEFETLFREIADTMAFGSSLSSVEVSESSESSHCRMGSECRTYVETPFVTFLARHRILKQESTQKSMQKSTQKSTHPAT